MHLCVCHKHGNMNAHGYGTCVCSCAQNIYRYYSSTRFFYLQGIRVIYTGFTNIIHTGCKLGILIRYIVGI